MPIEYRYAKSLEKGDSIIIANGNYLDIGFFIGYGRGTIQYYTPKGIIYWKEQLEKGFKYTPSKHYCQETSIFRVAKFDNPEFLEEIEEIKYHQAKDFLKEQLNK
jgi:hypothetical protein